jgi:hypothetical protein
MSGHHVRHLPTNEEELQVAKRIHVLIRVKSLTKIAELLTAEGIPPPCKSKRATSGAWNAKTVYNIATNKMLIAILEYGKTSSGKYHRFTKDGPRILNENDVDSRKKPKVIQIAPEDRMQTPLPYAPLILQTEFESNQQFLEQRKASRKGISRAKR